MLHIRWLDCSAAGKNFQFACMHHLVMKLNAGRMAYGKMAGSQSGHLKE